MQWDFSERFFPFARWVLAAQRYDVLVQSEYIVYSPNSFVVIAAFWVHSCLRAASVKNSNKNKNKILFRFRELQSVELFATEKQKYRLVHTTLYFA